MKTRFNRHFCIHTNLIKCLLFVIAMYLFNASQAQDGGSSFYLAIGNKGVSLDETNIEFSFVDNSPSMDNLSTDVDLEAFSNPFTVNIGFLSPLSDAFVFKSQLDGFTENNFFGVSLELGVGYVLFGNDRVTLTGDIFLGYTYTSLKLGKINNNALFIQINDREFFDPSLNVRLVDGVFTYHPNLTGIINVAGPISVIGQIGYVGVFVDDKPEIRFAGLTAAENVSIDDENATLTVNGTTTQDSLIDFGGITFNVGIAYTF